VRLARLERDAQRHAFAQQMLLAYDFAQVLRAQALGQGLVSGGRGFHKGLGLEAKKRRKKREQDWRLRC